MCPAQKAAEGQHALGGSKGIQDLIEEAKPGSNISDVCWGWEIMDGIKVLLSGSNILRGNFKSCKVNSVSSKDELVRVENDAVLTT